MFVSLSLLRSGLRPSLLRLRLTNYKDTTFNLFSLQFFSPNFVLDKIKINALINTVTYAANNTCPIPVASPTAIAKKTLTISLAVPGIDLNLINPKAPKLKGVKAGKKAVTVKWAKVAKEINGYQIAYSTKKNFKKSVVVKVTSKKAVTKTIKKLKANTKYFVRIRTFKKVGKTTFKSAWSKAKSIKTK